MFQILTPVWVRTFDVCVCPETDSIGKFDCDYDDDDVDVVTGDNRSKDDVKMRHKYRDK